MSKEQTIEEKLKQALILSSKIKKGVAEVLDEISDEKVKADQVESLKNLLESARKLDNELNRLEDKNGY